VTGLILLATWPAHADDSERSDSNRVLEEVTIVGDALDVANTAGSANVIAEAKLQQFGYADIQRIIREIPGVSVQVEDGFGLRPNLSIRGTPSERSARITLLEDNVLIAPAPYSAPSAYYFPTVGRMRQVEVLKGSSSIKQGPYTVGGSMNFLSTDITDRRRATANIEIAEHDTTRLHGVYGDSGENFGWLVEGHLWDSAGYQDIDIVGGDTGLDKDDWMLKLRFNSDQDATVYQQVDLKLQYAKEKSEQSYLGLTDSDFAARAYRRYAASQLDNIETEHDQVILRYLASFQNGLAFKATAYSNNHERDWFKTEGVDPDGSDSAESFERSSWFNVIQAVNTGGTLGSLDAMALQAILDGGDTLPGSIQVRSNARVYFSRGVQFGVDYTWQLDNVVHDLEFGLRFHEDEEDRLQRNSNYQQEGGVLMLNDLGLLGNAGNRIQEAEATSFFVYDRISWNKLVLTPGIRYEDIDQARTRWETRAGNTMDPSSRDESNIRDTRDNNTQVWIPGLGALYDINDSVALYGGIHKGFTAPSNATDVDEEESINYELGIRYSGDRMYLDTAAFFTDYDNILGECTASSGSDCEIGDAFNGDAASIAGLEFLLNYNLARNGAFTVPLVMSYTYLNGEFDSDIADTDFFGDVSRGDPLPYIPEHQALVSLGLERNMWGAYVTANYVDETCVRASCGPFETTDETLVLDLAANYTINENVTVYGRVNNVTSEEAIVGRHPYGARPNMDRTIALGVRLSL
jgi:Fe(3+) dicitrate transport protein